MSREELIELLKSGDFTIAYHDAGVCSIYRGKMKYGELPEGGELKDFMGCYEGYKPRVVEILVEALGGMSVTV